MDWETRDRIDRENQRRQEQVDRMRAEGERIKEQHRQMRQDLEERQRHNELISAMRSRGRSVGTGSSTNATGAAALIGLIFFAWLFVTFAPWVLGIGGALLLGIGGKKLMEIAFPRYRDSTLQLVLAIVLALVAGGIGFNKGLEIQREYGSSQPPNHIQSAPNVPPSPPK